MMEDEKEAWRRRENFVSRLIHDMTTKSNAEAFTINMIKKAIAAYDDALKERQT